MNHLESQIQLDVLHEAALLFVLGELRSIQRRGHPVDLSSEKPFIYYYLQQYYFTPSGQRGLSLYPDAYPFGDPSDLRFQVSYWLGIPQLECAADIWDWGRPNRVQAEIRERVARAKFDLARILIAQRILELQGKGKASSVVDLVPDLLPEEPLDPFVEQPYRYAEERHCFYSAGPDGEDNRVMLFYDPTNGTLSAGDIVLGE